MSRWTSPRGCIVNFIFAYCLLLSLRLTPSHAEKYTYLTYSKIHLRLTQLSKKFPRLIRLYSAQDRFSLPHVGECEEQESEDATPQPKPCTIWVVELSNFDTLPSDPHRPELLISGELHGDEVIGPHAVLAYLEYMTANYAKDPFIRRMIDTRLTTVVPMTNAIGFHSGVRGEVQDKTNPKSIDPNRDFGFDQKPDNCMQTVAARALNELFRVHLFRVLITFHGGTNVVGYEWGDTSHCDGKICKPAPDTAMMAALGHRMAHNAGSAGRYEAAYPVGDMGKLVYSVNGGLEDWAYGASWANEATVCNPKTLGGYARSKTVHDRATKRCVTYLVETARDKKPLEHSLGSSESVMRRGSEGDGHIPRNIRLLLTAVDSVEPYFLLDEEVSKDEKGGPVLTWSLGGSFVVDGSLLQFSVMNGTSGGLSGVLNGTAGMPATGGRATRFSRAVPGKHPTKSSAVFVRVAAVVDHVYAKRPEESDPDLPPQSHLMGSRASNTWSFSVGEHKLEGRTVFFSGTKKITVKADGGFEMKDADNLRWGPGTDTHLYSQPEDEIYKAILRHSNVPEYGVEGPPTAPSNGSSPSTRTTILAGVISVVSIVAIAIFIYICIGRSRSKRRAQKGNTPFTLVDDEEEEERRALTPSDGNEDFSDEPEEEVISASGLRNSDGMHHTA